MAELYDPEQLREIEKKIKALPALPKKLSKAEALESLSKSIVKLAERGYNAPQIADQLTGFGFKTSIRQIKRILNQAPGPDQETED